MLKYLFFLVWLAPSACVRKQQLVGRLGELRISEAGRLRSETDDVASQGAADETRGSVGGLVDRQMGVGAKAHARKMLSNISQFAESKRGQTGWLGRRLAEGDDHCVDHFGPSHNCTSIQMLFESNIDPEDIYCKLLRWQKEARENRSVDTDCAQDEEDRAMNLIKEFRRDVASSLKPETPRLVLISGSVATGKSTFIDRYVSRKHAFFVNADKVRGDLVGGYNIFAALKNNRMFAHRAFEKARKLKNAMRDVVRELKGNLIFDGVSAFSPDLVKEFKRSGYAIDWFLLEIGCGNVSTSCSWDDKTAIGNKRIMNRVAQNGHRARIVSPQLPEEIRTQAIEIVPKLPTGMNINFVISQGDRFWRAKIGPFVEDVGTDANLELGDEMLGDELREHPVNMPPRD